MSEQNSGWHDRDVNVMQISGVIGSRGCCSYAGGFTTKAGKTQMFVCHTRHTAASCAVIVASVWCNETSLTPFAEYSHVTVQAKSRCNTVA